MKFKRFILIKLFLLSIVTSASAQVTGGEFKDLMKDDMESKLNNEKMLTKESMPVGNSVDPKFYYLGAGDILSIKIMPQSINATICEITPDGKLILPRALGEIDIKNKTLFEAQQLVLDAVTKVNPKSTVSVYLTKARTCLVNISGNVQLPGSFAFPASYKVSTVLNYLSQVGQNNAKSASSMELTMRNQEQIRDYERKFAQSGIGLKTIYSNRNIVLINDNGNSKVLDVEKALYTKDNLNDPYIREGDRLIVPFEEKFYPKIGITGAISRPVTVVYKKGDKLSELVKFGLALTDNSDLNNVKLIDPDGKQTPIEVDAQLNLKSADMEIQPGSNILFGSISRRNSFNSGIIGIRGEVQNEGSFPIINNQTKLVDVLEMAGGLREDALLEQAYIIRKNPNLSEDFQTRPLTESMENFDLTLEDTMRYAIDIQNNNFFVSSDLKNAVKNTSSSDNVKLQDGDFIVIPKKQNRVYIFGRVLKPGYLEFSENKNLEYYIRKAGGYAKNADASRTRIIRGASNVWIKPEDDVYIFDGDRIYVPAPPDVPQQVADAKYGMVAGIIGASASVLFLLINTIFSK